jgi:hypothetical protein
VIDPAERAAGASENVFSLRPGWPAVDDARILMFLRHWAAARRGAVVPARSAIDPTAIGPCLPNMFMYRYIADKRDFALTLAGEEVKSFWREPLKNRSMRDVLGREAGELAIVRGLLVVDTPALLYTRASTITRPDAFYSVTRMTAPLLNDSGEIFGTIGISIYLPEAEGRQTSETVSLHDCGPLRDTAP